MFLLLFMFSIWRSLFWFICLIWVVFSKIVFNGVWERHISESLNVFKQLSLTQIGEWYTDWIIQCFVLLFSWKFLDDIPLSSSLNVINEKTNTSLIFFFVANLVLVSENLQDFLFILEVQELYQCMFKYRTKKKPPSSIDLL